MPLTGSVRWRGLDPVTHEHCELAAKGAEQRIRGTIVAPAYGLFYRIQLDENGHVRQAKIERTDGKVLELFSDGAGSWSDDYGEPMPKLRGCIDIDLWPTPLTNSLPLWRREWKDGDRHEFTMAWIDGDEMIVRPDKQVYTRLDATHFRFENADGFERVLEVDDDLLVVTYPELFVRDA
jgi:hypothetical protein